MVTPEGLPLGSSKLMNFMTFDLLGVYGALGNILTSIVSNFHFGKRFVPFWAPVFAPMLAKMYTFTNDFVIADLFATLKKRWNIWNLFNPWNANVALAAGRSLHSALNNRTLYICTVLGLYIIEPYIIGPI